MLSYETTYYHALNVVQMYEDLVRLEKENEYLRNELDKKQKQTDQQFKDTNNELSRILDTVISGLNSNTD